MGLINGNSDIVGTKTAKATMQILAQQAAANLAQESAAKREAQWQANMLKQMTLQSELLGRIATSLEAIQAANTLPDGHQPSRNG